MSCGLVPKLFERLEGQRSDQNAERRMMFVPNFTPAAALAIAATVSKRAAEPFREFLQKYLCREHDISAITLSWGFIFELHICYHALRPGPVKVDSRLNANGDERLRSGELLPLRHDSRDREELYFYEAQSSSLCWGPDEWFWTELFLVETWFGSEPDHKTYLEDECDPPLAGGRSLQNPCYDPREYFLLKLDRRLEQATSEYSALIGTFNQRMKEYATKIRHKFHDDDDQNLTRTLSGVLDTVQTFVDCIGGIIDTWEIFYRTQISLFTTHAADKLGWPPILESIMRHIFKLARFRSLLLIQRERFRSKLESLHTVSSLRQADTANKQAGSANLQAKTAVAQGTDLKILTQMTVYVAFPLLFTTAFFSMDFVKPPYPGAVFTGVLVGVTILNYLLAWMLRRMVS